MVVDGLLDELHSLDLPITEGGDCLIFRIAHNRIGCMHTVSGSEICLDCVTVFLSMISSIFGVMQ